MRRIATVAALALAGFAPGCGGGDNAAEVSAAAQSYVAAFTAHDAKATCLALTRSSQEQVAEFAREHMHLRGATCTKAVALLPAVDTDATVDTVKVDGSHATASVDGFDRPLTLVRENGKWRVQSSPAGEAD
jgi:predicted outer membrane protein